eukprot:COSAG02_NODE_4141_length_5727_cov_7.294808_1_plen_110_part_00
MALGSFVPTATGRVPAQGCGCSGAMSELAMPDRSQRDELFRRFDFNGNGMLSLAEIDKAVAELWPQFDHKTGPQRDDSSKHTLIRSADQRRVVCVRVSLECGHLRGGRS